MIDFEFDKVDETDKEKFIRIFKSLTSISEESKERIIKYLETRDFFIAPASTNFHNNKEGGLCNHSLNVARILLDLTKKNNLTWKHEESPVIIGLLHDICKVNFYNITYRNKKVNDEWIKVPAYQINDENSLLGIHGDRSTTMLLMLRTSESDFTIEELACIRYHMGDAQEGELRAFHDAMKKNVNVLWTHVADELAALSEPIVK